MTGQRVPIGRQGKMAAGNSVFLFWKGAILLLFPLLLLIGAGTALSQGSSGGAAALAVFAVLAPHPAGGPATAC